MYIYQLPDWPNFSWDQERLSPLLIHWRHQQGRLIGKMESLGFTLREEAILQTLTQDVVKSSEIEGETLDKALVRSSVARHLGIDIGGLKTIDRNVEGIVEMMLDATQRFDQPLTKARLFNWHATLFPGGRSGLAQIRVGTWRNDHYGPMQVVSGRIGREHIHYQAPPAGCLDQEMSRFLNWFNKETDVDPVLMAGIAHFWFATIHPFDDGNGRIARAIGDLMLARSEQSTQRFYSLSAQIQQERKDYYAILEQTQKGGLDITPWMEWFLRCLARAIDNTKNTLESVLRKAHFWETFAQIPLNDRQRKIITRLLDGFEGKLTSSKWAKMTKCSQDTAYRDILGLLNCGMLIKNSERGRSTSYSLPETIDYQHTKTKQKGTP
jgi:Fic family protein